VDHYLAIASNGEISYNVPSDGKEDVIEVANSLLSDDDPRVESRKGDLETKKIIEELKRLNEAQKKDRETIQRLGKRLQDMELESIY
jgi:hypothetical protein